MIARKGFLLMLACTEEALVVLFISFFFFCFNLSGILLIWTEWWNNCLYELLFYETENFYENLRGMLLSLMMLKKYDLLSPEIFRVEKV